MESEKYKNILDKYWRGETTQEEDELLINSGIIDDEAPTYFQALRSYRSIRLPDAWSPELSSPDISPSRKPRNLWKYGAAATLTLLIIASVWQHNSVTPSTADEIEMEKARQALILMSTKMNEGLSYTIQLKEFDTVIESVRN